MTTNAALLISQIDRLATLRERLDRVPPITGVACEKLDRAYDVDLTCASTQLSGSCLELHEVGLIIEKGLAIDGKRLADHVMVVDHDDAVQAMRRLTVEPRPLTAADIHDLHHRLVRRASPAGANQGIAAACMDAATIAAVAEWLAKAYGNEAAIEAHARMVAARPSAAGTGRLARLVMNLVLLRDGWPLVPIWATHALEYHRIVASLREAPLGDASAARSAHRRFMHERLIDACEAYLRVVAPTDPDETAGMPGWLARFVVAERTPTGRQQRVAVLVALRKSARAGAFGEIDAALRQVEPNGLNDYAISTLLRGTFAMRAHLPFWPTFRDRAAAVFETRGRDLKAVMIGLNR